MAGEITIRRAGPEEAGALTALIRESKRHWGYDESLMSLWSDELSLTPEFIRGNPVYMAEVHGVAAGVYALVRERGLASLEHMWVHPEATSRGVGRQLFGHAVETAGRMGVDEIEIVSDPNAEGFYRRMGARRDGAVPSRPPGRELPRLVYRIRREVG
jgi:N-acetylglutamate synthase-like GNAT family acetyltransferase